MVFQPSELQSRVSSPSSRVQQSTMDTESNYVTPPDCSCGHGKMRLFRAGGDATYPGCYYFKCPRFMQHHGHFHWLDEYYTKTMKKKR